MVGRGRTCECKISRNAEVDEAGLYAALAAGGERLRRRPVDARPEDCAEGASGDNERRSGRHSRVDPDVLERMSRREAGNK